MKWLRSRLKFDMTYCISLISFKNLKKFIFQFTVKVFKLRKYKGIQTANLISNRRGQISINSACIMQYLHFAIFFMGSRKPIFKSIDNFFKIHSTTVFSYVTFFRVQTRKTDVIVRSWWLRQTFSIKTAIFWTLKM